MNESLSKQNGVIYQNIVREQLGDDEARWFEEFVCAPTTNGGTLLTGVIADQAALRGVLDKIFALGLTLTALWAQDNVASQSASR
jgi:phage FluMu gp28-like protein